MGKHIELPLVSVLVPLHNHERFVGAALDSVLTDGYANVEIVACDDGSSDQSHEMARRWATDHPEVRCTLVRQRQQGIGSTLNRLARMAKGTYLIPLASDDELLPGGIQARIQALTRGSRAAFGDAEAIDASGTTIWNSFLEHQGANRRRLARDPAAEIIFNWAVPGPVLLVEADALREVGGYSEDLLVEDWDLYLRLAARGWLTFVDAPVARYRIHGAGASWRPENWGRMMRDQRLAATRNLHLFSGTHRWLLRFQLLVYTPPWRYPMRVVSKVARLLDRLVAKFGS